MPTPRSIIINFNKIYLCTQFVRVIIFTRNKTIAIIILLMVIKHYIYAVTILSYGVRIVIIAFLVSLLTLRNVSIARNISCFIYICYYYIAEIVCFLTCRFISTAFWLLNVCSVTLFSNDYAVASNHRIKMINIRN